MLDSRTSLLRRDKFEMWGSRPRLALCEPREPVQSTSDSARMVISVHCTLHAIRQMAAEGDCPTLASLTATPHLTAAFAFRRCLPVTQAAPGRSPELDPDGLGVVAIASEICRQRRALDDSPGAAPGAGCDGLFEAPDAGSAVVGRKQEQTARREPLDGAGHEALEVLFQHERLSTFDAGKRGRVEDDQVECTALPFRAAVIVEHIRADEPV